MIYTDAKGRPIEEPQRGDFDSVHTYLRAWWAWKNKLSDLSNDVFDRQFRKNVKKLNLGR